MIQKQRVRIKLPALSEFYHSNRKWLVLKSAIIGVLVGAMPAVGGTTAAVVSYGAAVRSSKHPETFGTGEPEGVIAPEVANNACAPAAMIPMLSLGIPGERQYGDHSGSVSHPWPRRRPHVPCPAAGSCFHRDGRRVPRSACHVCHSLHRCDPFHETSIPPGTFPRHLHSVLRPPGIRCHRQPLCTSSSGSHGDLRLLSGKMSFPSRPHRLRDGPGARH